MNSSRTSQDLKTERYFPQQILQNGRRVKVYIRIVSRKSIKVQLPAEISLSELKLLIRKKFQISETNQVLYMKGVCLNFNAQILLENDWIIHVINLCQVNLPEIKIEIKTSSLTESGQKIKAYSICPSMTVVQFLDEFIKNQDSVNLQEILLVESGRVLKLHLTFEGQNIQNGTMINLIHSKKDKKTHNSPDYFRTGSPLNQIHKYPSQKQSKEDSDKLIQIVRGKAQINMSNSSASNNDKCQIDQKQFRQFRDCSHHIQNSISSSSTSMRSSRNNPWTLNKSIQIGQRQCNCKKQTGHVKQPKFISKQDKRKLQKQIREQNLHKMMIKRQKLEENTKVNLSPSIDRRQLIKVKSLDYLKSKNTDRKSIKTSTNPETS